MTGERLDIPGAIVDEFVPAEQKGTDGVALGDATIIDGSTTSVTVEKSVEPQTASLGAALLAPGAIKSLVYMYNKILSANAQPSSGPSPKAKGPALNERENARVARISNGKLLNPQAPRLQPGALNDMLALFAMLDQRGVLYSMPNIRRTDLAVYARLVGKPGRLHRLIAGPFVGRRRQRVLGAYSTLAPMPAKKQETVYIKGQDATRRLDQNANAALRAAPALAPVTATKLTVARPRMPLPDHYQALKREKLLRHSVARPEEAPRPYYGPARPALTYG